MSILGVDPLAYSDLELILINVYSLLLRFLRSWIDPVARFVNDK
jgi:hypothetical protein